LLTAEGWATGQLLGRGLPWRHFEMTGGDG
jgi:hypothetical protein